MNDQPPDRYAIELQRLTAALQESEMRLSAIINSPMDGIISADEKGRITLFNPAAEKLFRCSAAQAMGLRLDRFIPAAYHAVCSEDGSGAGETELQSANLAPGALTGIRADGSEFPLEASISEIELAGRKLLTVILRDITERKQAELAVIRSEESLARAQQIAHLGDWDQDFVTDNLRWSDEVFRIFGAPPQSFPPTGETFFAMVHPEDVDSIKNAVAEAIRSRLPYSLDHRIVRRDGELRYVHEQAEILYDRTGQAVRMVGTVQDITERKRTEALAIGQRRVMEMIAQNAPPNETLDVLLKTIEADSDKMLCSILLLDADGIHLRHASAPRLPAEYTKAIDGTAIGPNVGSCGTAAFRRQPVFVEDIDSDPLWKDYRELALSHGLRACWSTPIFDAGQQVLGTFAIYYRGPARPRPRELRLIDIATQTAAICITRHRTEAALRESEERLQSVVENLTEGLILSDLEGRILHCNRPGFEMHGFDNLNECLKDLPYFEQIFEISTIQGAVLQIGQWPLSRVIAGEHLRDVELRLRRIGTDWERFFSYGGAIVREPSGKRLAFVTVTDITDRKRAEQRLAAQAAVSRVLAETVSLSEATPKIIRALCEAEGWEFGAIWEVDHRTNVLRCVDVWHRPDLALDMLAKTTRGLTLARGAALPGRVWETGGPLVAPQFEPDVRQDTNRNGAAIAEQAGLRVAVGFPILVRGQVTGVVHFLAREVHGPDAFLFDRLAVIGSQIGQFIERRQAEEKVQRFLSSSPAVIYALEIGAGLFRHTWTSDNVMALTGYLVDEAAGLKWWVRNIHDEDRDRILAAHPMPYQIEHQVLEYRFRRKDGSYFWMHDEKRLLRDPSGRPAEIIGSWSDVTERVELEEQLRQSQKMDAVGRLAGGVAHDFNNLLTVVLGFCDLLLARLPEGDSRSELVRAIQQAGERAATLTRQLLAFSRKQMLETRVLDLNEVVVNVERMLARLIGEDIVMTAVLSPLLTRVKVDPTQIEQVLINLAVNARDAMPYGGKLTIETHDVELDAEYCRLHAEFKPGKYTLLSVSDTGGGMTPEVRGRVFEPFFTTKEVGKGTGLGLATVFGIIKQSEGQIEVYSEVGVGTCFKIYLPAIVEAAAPLPSGLEAESVRKGSETVLLVEDEEGVRKIAKLAIENYGYAVLEASNGPEAIEVVAGHGGPIDLLVTDVVMPGMSGRELVAFLKVNQPHLKVLFMSGYVDDAVIRHGIIGATDAFLQKPFSPRALAGRVREILDANLDAAAS